MNYKTYTIENKKFNAVALGKELGVSQQTARNRLKVAKTIAELYKPLYSTKYKVHVIENKKFTAPELAKILNCSDSTARARLNSSSTLNALLKPISDRLGTKSLVERVVDLNNKSIEISMRKLLMGAW